MRLSTLGDIQDSAILFFLIATGDALITVLMAIGITILDSKQGIRPVYEYQQFFLFLPLALYYYNRIVLLNPFLYIQEIIFVLCIPFLAEIRDKLTSEGGNPFNTIVLTSLLVLPFYLIALLSVPLDNPDHVTRLVFAQIAFYPLYFFSLTAFMRRRIRRGEGGQRETHRDDRSLLPDGVRSRD